MVTRLLYKNIGPFRSRRVAHATMLRPLRVPVRPSNTESARQNNAASAAVPTVAPSDVTLL